MPNLEIMVHKKEILRGKFLLKNNKNKLLLPLKRFLENTRKHTSPIWIYLVNKE